MKLDDSLLPILYMLAAIGFILAIKWLGSPATARRGVIVGEIGMLLAVVGTLLRFEVVNYQWILIAFFLGAAVGVPIAYIMPMTAVPQRTAFSHACGALASALIGTAEYYKGLDQGAGLSKVVMIALIVETLLGFLTFTASMMAFGKLQEVLAQRPITYRGQNFVNLGVFAAAAGIGLALVISPEQTFLFPVFIALALLFGVLLIIPIGGADMPTVIALLNSYAGLSASAEEAAQILDSARNVVVIPGYGMAVAQAQHKLREMFDMLTRRGVDVRFAIHPVAGRMPGHMNVLLAEADVPYDKLWEMDDINPEMANVDVALIIGANDVVNPGAETDPNSAIAGMPIIQAYKARTVMVIKRSMNPGFAGIDNELYYRENTLMLFGDAKAFLSSVVKELGALVKA